MTRPHPDSAARAPDEARTKDGYLIDEYSSEADNLDPAELRERMRHAAPRIDALDVMSALTDLDQIEDSVADVDGVIENTVSDSPVVDTVDSGARMTPTDDGEMGLGAEPHSAEELERAAIGDALRGRAAVTRDDTEHGARFLDTLTEADDSESSR